MHYLVGVELWSVYNQPSERHCSVRKVLVEDDGLRNAGEQLFENIWQARSVLARRGLQDRVFALYTGERWVEPDSGKPWVTREK